MPAPGGYSITPGLYRVPDLLTEEQFVDYMKSTYGRTVEFTDVDNSISPARALGRTVPMGVLHEGEEDSKTPKHPDPVLKSLNELDFSYQPEPAESVDEGSKADTKKPTTSRSSSK